MAYYDTKYGKIFSTEPVGDGEIYPPDVLETISSEEMRQYKTFISDSVRKKLGATANTYGFQYVEDAERRFRGNGDKWFYAQLIEEWAVEVYFKAGKHLQETTTPPTDNGVAFLASLPAFDPNRVPAEVTMFQAHIALELDSTLNVAGTAYADDKLAQVDAYLLNSANFADIREQRRAQIAWNVSGGIRRDAALVTAIGTALGYDEAGLDNLFRTAVRIRPEGSGNA